MKYAGKGYDIDDIRYILKEYSDNIPEKVISDLYFQLLEYVDVDPVLIAKEAYHEEMKN